MTIYTTGTLLSLAALTYVQRAVTAPAVVWSLVWPVAWGVQLWRWVGGTKE